jgi:glucose-1-phosphate cytidylyltransferase
LKAVILAGGLGSRIAEETTVKPKPMIEIGGKPILWHIMKIYSHHGINDFIICCGYKGYVIKEYFSNYFLHMSDVTFDMSENTVEVHNRKAEPWKVTLVDTGEDTMTGGRIKRISKYIENEDAFCMTYGDGVGDVNITELIAFHKSKGTLATLTATLPPGRFGALQVENGKVLSVKEKPRGDGASINGGYFVLSPSVIELIPDDQTSFTEDFPSLWRW